jgi:hypothetical protein
MSFVWWFDCVLDMVTTPEKNGLTSYDTLKKHIYRFLTIPVLNRGPPGVPADWSSAGSQAPDDVEHDVVCIAFERSIGVSGWHYDNRADAFKVVVLRADMWH